MKRSGDSFKMIARLLLMLSLATMSITLPYDTPRMVVNSEPQECWPHREVLDSNGNFVLSWVSTDTSITFKIEGKTTGYVSLGFNSHPSMREADIVVAWVDDRDGTAHLLDCHGELMLSVTGAVADETQNYALISGHQNDTHTIVEFRRMLDTCDLQDHAIDDHITEVLWSLGPPGSDGLMPKHKMAGHQKLMLLQPAPRGGSELLLNWDVTLTNISIPSNMASLFWCKVFSVPASVMRKSHIVGYEPILKSNGKTPVRHALLYECPEGQDEDRQIWNDWADGDGYFGPSMPREWSSCYSPVAVWAIGSKGEYYPENVGIPLGGKGNPSFYMLEIHYDNRELVDVLDSSGLRIKYTYNLRKNDGGLLGSGVAVSAMHLVAPNHPAYTTPGICSRSCTEKMFPEEGVTVESVLLHAHTRADKIKLRHIRDRVELPTIAEENSFDSYRQRSKRVADGGRKVKRGDYLITECTYDTTHTNTPILGGYAPQQEMCISFMVYWPRTPLVGCYSMSSVNEFFETFNVRKFYNTAMQDVENMFLASGTYESFPQHISFDLMQQQNSRYSAMQGDDQGVALLNSLIIEEPQEFANKSFIEHLNEIPWKDPILSKKIHESLFRGPHTLVCKNGDNTLGVPIEIQNYPTYEELVTNETTEDKPCDYRVVNVPGVTRQRTSHALRHRVLNSLLLVCMFALR